MEQCEVLVLVERNGSFVAQFRPQGRRMILLKAATIEGEEVVASLVKDFASHLDVLVK